MATFFGEILLPSSRVFFNDNDDSDSEAEDAIENADNLRNSFLTKQFNQGSLNLKSELLIICEGPVARGFADLYLLNNSSQLISEIVCKKNELKDTFDEMEAKRPKSQPTSIYSLCEKIKLIDVSPEIDLSLANDLTLEIEELLKNSDKIMILCSRSISDFRCDSINDLPPSFLRCLSTANTSNSDLCKTLEQPNFISDFPASVLSWSECLDKDCQLYICYTDKAIADSITLSPFVNLFNKTPQLMKLSKKRALISKFAPPVDQSFMYM